MKFIIFTGLSACGKTTISQEISSQLGIPRVDFHAIAHRIAEKHGFLRLRDWAKNVGTSDALEEATQKLIQELRRVGTKNPTGIVVDEIVAPSAFESIQKMFPRDEFYVIWIKARIKNRIRNMTKRVKGSGEGAREAISFRDRFKYSFGIERMMGEANFTFDNNGTVKKIADEVTQTVRREIFKERDRKVLIRGRGEACEV